MYEGILTGLVQSSKRSPNSIMHASHRSYLTSHDHMFGRVPSYIYIYHIRIYYISYHIILDTYVIGFFFFVIIMISNIISLHLLSTTSSQVLKFEFSKIKKREDTEQREQRAESQLPQRREPSPSPSVGYTVWRLHFDVGRSRRGTHSSHTNM